MRIFPNGSQRINIRTASRWGLAGSGVIYYCQQDNTILLLERSLKVEDSGTWGIPGGAVKGTDGYYQKDTKSPEFSEDELRYSALLEVSEEIGHIPEYEREEGSHMTDNNNFKYTTFLRTVNPQQKQEISRNIILNWESDDYKWFKVDALPNNVHPGVIEAVKILIMSKNK